MAGGAEGRAHEHPGLGPHGGHHRVARAGAGREPAPRGPEPARGGRGLPAAARGVRPDAGRGRRAGWARAARPSPTPSGCSSSRRSSSGWSPRASSPPATPGRCWARPTARSRKSWPSSAVAEGLTVREVEDLVRRQVQGDTPSGGAGGPTRTTAGAAAATLPARRKRRPARARGAPRRPPRHPCQRQHGGAPGPDRDRVRHVEDLERIYGVIIKGPPTDA